jgi:undecaprenyl-diphosphatase
MGDLADRLLALHGWPVLLVVFLLPALEASAFVGVVVPGEIAVLLGGVLAFQHRVSLPAVIAAAVAGAIVGDNVGYLVGRRWGRTILDGSLGRLVRRGHLDRAERFLAERGGPAVLIGRFTAALRALVPGLAGMAGLRYRTFLLYNAAGGLLWATGFVLLGYAAGTGWRQVERAAGRASLLLALALVATGAVVLGARWVAAHPERVRAVAGGLLDRPAPRRLRERYRDQLDFLARRLRPEGALGLTLTATAAALVAAGWGFGAVLQDVLGDDELALVDRPVQGFFAAHREAWLTPVVRGIGVLGSPAVLAVALAAAGLAWWARARSWRQLALLGTALGGALGLSMLTKQLTHRPRPPAAEAIGHWAGFAFPSAHAACAAAGYGMLAALLAACTPRWGRKVALWAGAVAIACVVALSRLYLGASWLTDVLGGLALGAAWLTGLLTVARTVPALWTAATTSPPRAGRAGGRAGGSARA